MNLDQDGGTHQLQQAGVPAADFGTVLEARISRRQALGGGVAAAGAAIFGSVGLAGCGTDEGAGSASASVVAPPSLAFAPVDKSRADRVVVPAGYEARVLYALGDPLAPGLGAYPDDGSTPGAEFAQRAGDHHDGMSYFGLNAAGDPDPAGNSRGLIAINHENITQKFLHATVPDNSAPRDADEALKEQLAHGVAVFEIVHDAGGWAVVRDSRFNRRITPLTPMEIAGPARGSEFVRTLHDPAGERTRGTINNCANGQTPWGTYLSCEENWNGYFRRAAADDAARGGSASADVVGLKRYGLNQGSAGNNNWSSVAGDAFRRWDASATGADASQDYRNEPNCFGWVVEIDPFDPTSTPRKRTALGRFAHEGCWIGPVKAGKPVVFYMGDDQRNDYVYKFVSEALYDPADRGLAAGDKYMDRGTLYVARFNGDSTGQWIALRHNSNGLNAANAIYPFVNQAAVLVHARLAADAVGATKMDRPEWAAVNPLNGEVYLTLTNNSNRRPLGGTLSGSQLAPDAANPRAYEDVFSNPDGSTRTNRGNVNGHIIRWRESGGDPAATSFRWDIFLFGAPADADPATVNLSALAASNDFSSPDGLWFDERGILWIQTDDGAYTDVSNCMLLAAAPGEVGDGGARTIPSGSGAVATPVGRSLPTADLRRFLVGPRECEITGICMTPDRRTMFVNVQHPGEDTAASLGVPSSYGSRWPASADATADALPASTRPRSATIVITRQDGGEIAI